MERSVQNIGELERLLRLLRFEPKTAAEIMKKTKCSKPSAYRRLQQLKKLGCKFKVEKVRKACTGPKSKVFQLIKGVGCARCGSLGETCPC